MVDIIAIWKQRVSKLSNHELRFIKELDSYDRKEVREHFNLLLDQWY